MKKIEVLIGISGSGKSTYANELKEQGCHILSSDDIREEMFGGLHKQSKEDHGKVFEELYKRVQKLQNENDSYWIVIDATNLNLKRRTHLYNNLFSKDALIVNNVFFVGPYEAMARIDNRNRGDMEDVFSVVSKQFKNLQMPIAGVDCDAVKLSGQKMFQLDSDIKSFSELSMADREGVFSRSLYNDGHDTPYHLESIPEHIDFTQRLSRKIGGPYETIALYHDTGKFFCKEFNGEYAKYLNHENVSGQIYANVCYSLSQGLSPLIQKAIQLHMIAHNGISNKIINRYNLTDEEKDVIMKFAQIDRACAINYTDILEGGFY